MANLDQAFASMQSQDEAHKALLSQEQGEMTPYLNKGSEIMNSPRPKPPEEQKVPNAPHPLEEHAEDAQNWITAMSVLSGVTGAFSRQHATTALNAFASGVDGYQKGQKEAVDQAYKQWDAQSKAAIENNKILRDKYQSVLDDRKLSLDEQLEQVKMVAAKYHDTLTYQAAESKNMLLVAKIMESQQAAYDKAIVATEALHAKEEKDKEKKDPSITQAAADFAANQVLAGDKSALSNYGRGEKATANLSMIHQAVQRIAAEKGITGDKLAQINAQFAGTTAEQRVMGTRAGTTKVGAAELEQLIPATKDAVKKLDLSQFPDYNSFKNYAASHTGDPDVTNAAAMLQETQNAYTALLVRGGQRTDAAQAASEHLLNMAMSPDQTEGVLNMMSKNASLIMRGIENAKSGNISGKSKDGWSLETAD